VKETNFGQIESFYIAKPCKNLCENELFALFEVMHLFKKSEKSIKLFLKI